MGRIRNIKPQFFKDSDLYDAEEGSGLPLRVAYAGLWTIADRAGRFRWKPREIKTDILPYDNIDMSAVLEALVKYGFVFKYSAAGFEYGYIPNFEKHQFINRNEAQSTLPPPPENSNAQSATISEPSLDEQAQEIHSELLVVLDTDGLTQTQTEESTSADADRGAAIQAYNAVAEEAGWPKAQHSTKSRAAQIKARLRECGGIEGWNVAMAKARASPFLRGELGRDAAHATWVPDLDFFLKAQNFTKLMEGKYDQRDSRAAATGYDALGKGARRAAGLDAGQGQGVASGTGDILRRLAHSAPTGGGG